MRIRLVLTAIILLLANANLRALDERPTSGLVSRISLDPATGVVAVTVQYLGPGSARISLSELAQAANTYSYRLAPVSGGERGMGVITGAQSKQRPALIAGQASPPPEEPTAITLTGPLVVGYAFPIWETGIWAGFPKRFEQSPTWEIRPSLAIRRLDRAGQPDEFAPTECTTGFILDKDMWNALERIRTQGSSSK